MKAGKCRLAGDAASGDEVRDVIKEACNLKEAVAERMLENASTKKNFEWGLQCRRETI